MERASVSSAVFFLQFTIKTKFMIKNFNILNSFTAFIVFLLLNLGTTQAQNGPVCDTYVNATTSNGLGNKIVRGVYVSGSTVYAATPGGLSISIDGAPPLAIKPPQMVWVTIM